MGKLFLNLETTRDEILKSNQYKDILKKAQNPDTSFLRKCHLSRIDRDGSLSMDYVDEIEGFTYGELATIGVKRSFLISNVIWVTEDFNIDGVFKGYEVTLGISRNYFKTPSELFKFVRQNPENIVISYSSDCGEEAINLIENLEDEFTRTGEDN